MTIEKVLKLSNIQYPEDLAWRIDSYDAGHPKCLCSACGQHVKSSESFLEQDNYFDAADNPLEVQLRANFPIRITRGRGKYLLEAVIHTECYQWLDSTKNLFRS
jgi:hypothetical protein